MCMPSHCGRILDFKLSSSFQFSLMFHFSSFVRFELGSGNAVRFGIALTSCELMPSKRQLLNAAVTIWHDWTHEYIRTCIIEYGPWNICHCLNLPPCFSSSSSCSSSWRIDFTFFYINYCKTRIKILTVYFMISSLFLKNFFSAGADVTVLQRILCVRFFLFGTTLNMLDAQISHKYFFFPFFSFLCIKVCICTTIVNHLIYLWNVIALVEFNTFCTDDEKLLEFKQFIWGKTMTKSALIRTRLILEGNFLIRNSFRVTNNFTPKCCFNYLQWKRLSSQKSKSEQK